MAVAPRVSIHTNRGHEAPLIVAKAVMNEAKQYVIDVCRCGFVFMLWEQGPCLYTRRISGTFYKESKFTYESLICCEIFVGKDFLYDDLRIPA